MQISQHGDDIFQHSIISFHKISIKIMLNSPKRQFKYWYRKFVVPFQHFLFIPTFALRADKHCRSN